MMALPDKEMPPMVEERLNSGAAVGDSSGVSRTLDVTCGGFLRWRLTIENVCHFCWKVGAWSVNTIVMLNTHFIFVAGYGAHLMIRVSGILEVRHYTRANAVIGVSV